MAKPYRGQSARFIDEFGADVLKKVRIRGVEWEQFLCENDSTEQVNLCVEVPDGDGTRVLLDTQVLFDKEETDHDTVLRVMDLLGLTEKVAAKRLRKAELISAGPRYFP
jgi:hypothetical protein